MAVAPITPHDLLEAIDRLEQGRVLIVGDIAIDEMIYGNTARLSREAPVVLLHHEKTDIILGCAGNAAHNIASLGSSFSAMIGVCGDDYYATHLRQAMTRDGVDPQGLVVDKSRPTTTKTRISGTANHSVTQQIVRIDRESRETISPDIEAQLIDHIEALAPQANALLLSDYALGVVTDRVIERTLELAKTHNLKVAVDSQRSLSQFPGVSILTPNQPEAEANLGYALTTWDQWLDGGFKLLKACQAENMLITRGAAGMVLYQTDGTVSTIPAFNRSEVFDVTGAGDTVVGTLILATAAGVPIPVAAVLGNLAASIVVKRFGAATTTPDELRQAVQALDPEVLHGIETFQARVAG